MRRQKHFVWTCSSYIMNGIAVSNPADSAHKDIRQLQVLDGFRKGNLVLRSQLDLLSSIRSSAGNVDEVHSLSG